MGLIIISNALRMQPWLYAAGWAPAFFHPFKEGPHNLRRKIGKRRFSFTKFITNASYIYTHDNLPVLPGTSPASWRQRKFRNPTFPVPWISSPWYRKFRTMRASYQLACRWLTMLPLRCLRISSTPVFQSTTKYLDSRFHRWSPSHPSPLFFEQSLSRLFLPLVLAW